MGWAVVVKNLEHGKFQIVPKVGEFDRDGLYGDDINIVPCTETPEEILFGIHEFTRECCCHPKVSRLDGGPTLVIHTDQVN